MSNLLPHDDSTLGGDFDNQVFDCFDNPWFLHNEILEPAMNHVNVEQNRCSEIPQDEKVLKMHSKRTNIRRKNIRRINDDIEKSGGGQVELGASSSSLSTVAKKMDHNAKERIRRMKLNASYLALRALLPDSRRSKKRWSSALIVDKVVKYIPELENEIETLKSKKLNLQSAANNQKPCNKNPHQNPTVSVYEINQGEAIFQICMGKSEFTDFLQRIEEDYIICIKSASTVHVCEATTCFHLHIEINQILHGADYIAKLREKIFSWLM